MPLKLKVELVSKYFRVLPAKEISNLKWREENNDKLPYISIIGSIAGRDQMQITMNAISASMQSVINGKFLGMPRTISRDWILFTGKENGPNYKSWQIM